MESPFSNWTLDKLYDGYYRFVNSSFNVNPESNDWEDLMLKIGTVYNDCLPMLPFFAYKVKNVKPISVYRIIPYPEKPLLIDGIKYAPVERCKLNRCGFNGEQVFYTSPDIETICNENKIRQHDTFIIAKFQFNPNGLCESRMYFNHPIYSSLNKGFYEIISSEEQKHGNLHSLIVKHLEHIRTQIILSANYLASSYIARNCLYNPEAGGLNTCISYPSLSNYQMGGNFALTKNAYDAGHIKPEACVFVKLKDYPYIKENMEVVSSGTISINQKEEINWVDGLIPEIWDLFEFIK